MKYFVVPQVENSPFVERLIKKGYEVLYLVEAIDEYAINAIPEFEGKKFQNVAKEGLTIDEGEGAKERLEELKKVYEPLTKWLSEDVLKEEVCVLIFLLVNNVDNVCFCNLAYMTIVSPGFENLLNYIKRIFIRRHLFSYR